MSTFYKREWTTDKHENSTAEKFYDIEQSQKRYQELLDENLWLKNQINKSKGLQTTSQHICPNCQDCTCQDITIDQGGNELVLWSMVQRNRYLQSKIDKLRNQFQRQSKTISNIKSSDKWKNRLLCSNQSNSCYEDKYLQLLRIRSPFY